MALRVLIVDDEPDILEILSFNLKKNGYTVESATNGVMGLKLVDSFKPDLVLLDIMMPEMDGIEVARMIREKPHNKNLLIAFLTARSEDFTQISALDAGGDDFITKPIKPMVLMSRIKALLRRKEHQAEEEANHITEIGELMLDREQFIVKKNDVIIELAKKEFQLLNLIISKPGKVFTREEIFRKIWGNDVIVGNRTIDVHIRKIREKLGEEIIKTVKGIGYKFDS